MQKGLQLTGGNETAAPASGATKINNLQALRAFAATIVAFFHTGYVYPWRHAVGSYGVDLFFVLSGYIMARICEKDTRFFLRRRLIRILPPYWTLTILLFAFAAFFPQLLESTRANLPELIKSLFFIPFVKENGLVRPILFVGWSLNYEMLFYLIIALVLSLRLRRPIFYACMLLLGLHYAAILFMKPSLWSYFVGTNYVREFPLGVLAYYAAKKVSSSQARRFRVLSLLLVIGAIVALSLIQLYRPAMGYTFEGYLYNLLAFAAVLGTSLLSQGGWDTRAAKLILVGDASYVLYLIHPYCEYMLSRIGGPHLPFLRAGELVGGLIGVSLTIVVSILLHLYAERPVLNFLNLRFGGHRKGAEFGMRLETRGQVNP